MRTIVLTEEQLKLYTEALDVMGNPEITVLWLDDVRDPEKYLASKKSSGAFLRNTDYYTKLMAEYNPKFIWVHNIDEFSDWIVKNGLPDLVSFDHDLGKGVAKGVECARWLKRYCNENGFETPKWFVHSANVNGQRMIPQELNELVYINGVKGRKANLTYDNSGSKWHRNNLSQFDKIKTDKMDQTGSSDTYEVPLKGGMMSYNITSISGTEVMHYFKRYFDNQKTSVKIDGNDYELTMEANEFNRFMNNFKAKVWSVISHYINGLGDFKPVGISILPVKSSSSFNEKMAEVLSGKDINGLPCQTISNELFVKDMRNLEKDSDFIEKNKEYYSGRYYSFSDRTHSNDLSSVEDNVNAEIDKNKAINELRWCAKMLDKASVDLVNIYYRYNNTVKSGDERVIKNVLNLMIRAYRQYYGCYEYLLKGLTDSYKDANGNISSIYRSSIVEPIKSTKGPSVEQRTDAIWNIVKPYLRKEKSDITGEVFKKIPIYHYKELPFQIKNITDPIRMGMRNIYNPNENEEFVKQEVEKTVGTVFVIFDDNISGGATLSDICYQAKQLGIEHIVPITFGQMKKKVSSDGISKINVPDNGFNLNEKSGC